MTKYRKELGRKGEDVAVSYLRKNGYRILERNFTCRIGEIDVVALDDRTLVFVEVRTRRSFNYGRPEESVDFRKQSRLRLVAEYFLQRRGWVGCPVRFDVLAVRIGAGGMVEELNHLKAAF